MSSWVIKISRLVVFWAILFAPWISWSTPAADGAFKKRIVDLCESALVRTGLLIPIRASLVSTEGIDLTPELQAFHPSSYTTYWLNDLRYYPAQFLRRPYYEGKRVLDLYAGNGDLVEELRRRGVDAVGLSVSLNRIQVTRSHYIQGSARRTGIYAQTVDRILATLSPISLYYESDPQLVKEILWECRRILKVGGTLLIAPLHIPVDPWAFDVSPEELLKNTVFANLPSGLRIKAAPDRRWLQNFRDAELDQNRPRRASYWLEIERYK